jgi:D-tyrosyl-tRNA(Tyr) deacylase
MKAVIQRVSKASVEVEGEIISEIKNGMLILAGFGEEDDEDTAKKSAVKISKLRIFPDKEKDINSSVLNVKGEVLVVSQFTLLADTSAGNRPSFIKAASAEKADNLFNVFIRELGKTGLTVKTGKFQHYMRVNLTNEGPVTIIYEN